MLASAFSCPSPLGSILIVTEGQYLIGLYFAGQKHLPKNLPAPRTNILEVSKNIPQDLDENHPCKITAKWLENYFAGHLENHTPKIKYHGTDFQIKVWQELEKISYGETRSYGEIARILRTSPRAVGSAVARNPISLITPCHRVVGAHHEITGYAGGIDRKLKLLTFEKENLKKKNPKQ